MSKRNVSTPVPAKVIRTWARENEATVRALTVTKTVKGETVEVPANVASIFGGPQGTGRGRLGVNSPVVQAFLAANPGTTYSEKSEAEVKTVEVPMFSAKTGRPVKPIVRPIAEVRAAAGAQGKVGRLSAADLHRAALAFGSGEPKVAPAKRDSAPVKVTMD